MQRPILIATLGLLTGIIGGLYFQNIVPFIFLVLIFFIYYIKKLKKKNSFFKIVDLLIKKKVFLFFFIAFLIGNLYFLYYHHRYEAVYQHFSEQVITATIVSQPKETEYQKTYKIKLKGYYPPIYFLLRVSKNKKINLNYGDQVKIEGEYEIPEESRNEGGWNYREYLKTQSIYGIFKANTVQLLKRNQLDRIALSSNIVKQKIIYHMNQILPPKTRELFLGILIGYDEHLQAEIAESFQKSSLSHLLAVSGAHISYIVIGTSYLLSKLKIPKKIRNIFIALFLVFFMYLTSFTPSVMRASIMGIISILAFVFGKKYDLQTSMSISILLILMYNPYQILDIGLLLSYFATIGIISFLSFRKKRSKQDRNRRENKIVQLMKELVGITIFANIFVMPITLYHFNTISLSFILSNLVAGILIGPITIGGFIIILLSFIHLKFAYILSIPYELLLEILIDSTQLISKFPLSEILVPTPPISLLFLYYFILFLWLFYQQLKENFSHRYLVKKIIYFKESCLTFFRKKKFFFYLMIVFVILLVFLLKIIPKDLTIYFIDVGQGDSSLIVTPQNKKILIDSGGQSTGNFDVGKSTLLPYLLDKGVISLDYIFISHFDADHCQGFIYLLNHLHIKNIILAR